MAIRHSAIELRLGQNAHVLPDEAAQTVARMPCVEPIPLRLTGTHDAPDAVTATGPATGVHARAMRRDARNGRARKPR